MSSLLSSWVSTAMTQTTYYRANRKASRDKKNVDVMSSTLYFLWRMCELGPRYIVLVLTAFYLHPWCYIFVAIHVIFVTILYARDRPRLEGICTQPVDENTDQNLLLAQEVANDGKQNDRMPSEQESPSVCTCPSLMANIFIILTGIIGVFSYINLKEGNTLRTSMLFYVVFYIENILVTALVIYMSVSTVMVAWVYCLFAVPVGLFLHVVVVFIFYSFCHPTNTVCPPLNRCCRCCCKGGEESSVTAV